MHYLLGEDRKQAQMFSSLDDLIVAQHYVRLIDLLSEQFVLNNPDLFTQKGQQETGRKAYHPASLLKIFIYGYLNGVSSSRKLEKECGRNLEMMWLTKKLVPDHKTISDFRKDHSESIRAVVCGFNKLLRENGYIKGQTVSIDGTKVKAYAGGMSISLEGVEGRLEELDRQLEEYLSRMETEEKKEELEQEIAALEKEVNELREQKELLQTCSAGKLSASDPDARIMKARHGRFFSYNVQVAVDSLHHMIVYTETTNKPNDKGLLLPITEKVEQALEKAPQEMLADAGYFLTSDIVKVEKEKAINCYIALNENQQQNLRDQGINFTYNEGENTYTCSEGQLLLPKYGLKKDGKRGTQTQQYRGINCQGCPKKEICTSAEARAVHRNSDQIWRDNYRKKMLSEEGKTKLRQRKSLSEHPFATIKYLMGQIPLLLRGKIKVQSEIDLYTLAYNFKRLLNLEKFEQISKMITNKDWKTKPIS